MTERYTDEEIEQLRAQLREGNRLAKEAVQKRGVKLHPKIAAMRPDGEQAPPKSCECGLTAEGRCPVCLKLPV